MKSVQLRRDVLQQDTRLYNEWRTLLQAHDRVRDGESDLDVEHSPVARTDVDFPGQRDMHRQRRVACDEHPTDWVDRSQVPLYVQP